MHRQNLIVLALLVLVSVVIVAAGYQGGRGPVSELNYWIIRATGGMTSEDKLKSEKKFQAAPEFALGTWINSEPVTLKGLRGRVVLVDFWTFACYNCRNTLPFLNRWHERYADKGLTIVGVHSPELSEERQVENVRREVASLGIKYPVVTDNDYSTWNAYDVSAWPTVFLVDKAGRIRWMHVGEGAYGETERMIQELLAEDYKEGPR